MIPSERAVVVGGVFWRVTLVFLRAVQERPGFPTKVLVYHTSLQVSARDRDWHFSDSRNSGTSAWR